MGSETLFVIWRFPVAVEGEVGEPYPDVMMRAPRTYLLQKKELNSEADQFLSLLGRGGKWCYVSMAAMLGGAHP